MVSKGNLIILSITLFLLGCSPSEQFFDGAICLTNVSTIDAMDGLKNNMTVILKNDRILTIAPAEELALSNKNNIIDGTGKYLIPGLWDAHVHFAYMEDLAPSMFDLFLRHGITSVRDTGGKLDFVKKWKTRAAENPTTAPRVKMAGPLLDGSPNVYDGSTPRRPPLSVEAIDVEEALAIVDDLDKAGVDLIKAYEMLSPAQFKAVAADAKKRGLKVTGHVPLSMNVIDACDAGMNSMEHLRNIEMSCASDADTLQQARVAMLEAGSEDAGMALRSRIHSAQRMNAIENFDVSKADEVIASLARNNTWQIPTFTILNGMSRRHFGDNEWMQTFKLLPDTIGSQWTERVNNFMKIDVSEDSKKYTEWAFMMTEKIHQADVGIMAGTDCPIFFLTPGYSLHRELQYLVEAGLTELDALTSATLRPAQYFNMEDELGLIKEGYFADLILLNQNPLLDISHTLKINQVFKNGVSYQSK